MNILIVYYKQLMVKIIDYEINVYINILINNVQHNISPL